MNECDGLFIVFEGGEGSGKTSTIFKLRKWYEDQGREVICTREPGGSELGKMFRKHLLDTRSNITPRAELFMFLADRAQHMDEVISPALDAGKIVLCDRFIFSTIAYQGCARGVYTNMQDLFNLNMYAVNSKLPDYTFLFDVDVEEGLRRAQARNNEVGNTTTEGRFDNEKIEFHKEVYRGYRAARTHFAYNVHDIDANRSPDDVFNQVIAILK